MKIEIPAKPDWNAIIQAAAQAEAALGALYALVKSVGDTNVVVPVSLPDGTSSTGVCLHAGVLPVYTEKCRQDASGLVERVLDEMKNYNMQRAMLLRIIAENGHEIA